jgi:hypothetical protein
MDQSNGREQMFLQKLGSFAPLQTCTICTYPNLYSGEEENLGHFFVLSIVWSGSTNQLFLSDRARLKIEVEGKGPAP